MTLSVFFWLLMVLWFVIGAWHMWPHGASKRVEWHVAAGSLIPFLLFLALGWHVFGAPIR